MKAKHSAHIAWVLGLALISGRTQAADCVLEVGSSDQASFDNLGEAVSVYGNLVLVGAPMCDPAGSNSGAAYLFDRGAASSPQIHKFTSTGLGADDRFGASVSINNDLVVIGAPNDDDLGTNTGAAYVFRKVGGLWRQEQKLTGSGTSYLDFFGSSVSISNNVIAVGAYNQGNSGMSAGRGAVYIFRFNGTAWVLEKEVAATDGVPGDTFGCAVAVSGNRILVGAYQDQDHGILSGSAYVFTYTGSNWVQEAKLLPSNGAAYSAFGYAVAMQGELAVVGAYQSDTLGVNFGSAYVFRHRTSGWSSEDELFGSDSATNDRFGYSVATGADDNGTEVILVGAINSGRSDYNQNDGPGAVYRFTNEAGSWVQTTKYVAPVGAAYGRLGKAVSYHAGLNAIGAPAYSFPSYQSGAIFLLDDPCFTQETDECATLADGASCTDDDNPCTGDVCQAGTCTHSEKSNGTACEDGLFCNGADSCSGGECSVHAGNPCATGAVCNNVCNESADNCYAAANTACTADTNSCTNDICNGNGLCTHPVKAAGSPCGSSATSACDNADTCSATGVCLPNNRPNGTACADDGTHCTSDTCNAGVCTHPLKPAGTACGNSTAGLCDNPDTCNSSGVCLMNNLPNGAACADDGMECTSDTCSAGICTHPLKSDGTACDDGVVATSGDRCVAGVCTGTPQCETSVDCNDNNVCTTDSCVSGACQRVNNTVACGDDGNACTNDVCSAGACMHPTKPNGTACGSAATTVCSNPDSCLNGVCSANNLPSGTACTADTNACTNDICNGSGTCSHPLKLVGSPCGSSAAGLCDNADSCSATGVCLANNLPHGTACQDDGNECTADYCSAGACVHPVSANGSACDDRNLCTEDDFCANGVCRGTAVLCDDSDPCTVDSCGVKGCRSTPLVCPIGQLCVEGTCTSQPLHFCGDGVCNDVEDGCSCPVDCMTVAVLCGNGVCDAHAGENCVNCPTDCRGKLIGPPNKQFCCGADDDVSGPSCRTANCNMRGWTCVESTPCD